MRRVREELAARELNPNRLSAYGVKQKTLDDILKGAEPRINTIYAVAKALGMEAWELFTEKPARTQPVTFGATRKHQ